ncbi:hypothetical protein E3_0280 [Rhodococcus phage E3]|uniref:hypothetical protein n=1 Tax=Rhodococcus phage E3 TaxID=1007869 RepID=UPI0002C69789|nr:hypothetical protein M176_gp029 [Rhodococcus phage E3]AEQ20939.1 hypothetical protein E3_0280 [Rhodococcus phage E3]
MTNYAVIAEREGERGWRIVVGDIEHPSGYAIHHSDIERVAIGLIGSQYKHFDKLHITMRLADNSVIDVEARAKYVREMLAGHTSDYARREAYIVAAEFVWTLVNAGLRKIEVRDLLDISVSAYSGMLAMHGELVRLMALPSVKDGWPVPQCHLRLKDSVAEEKYGFPNSLVMLDHTTADGTKWIFMDNVWQAKPGQAKPGPVAPAALHPVHYYRTMTLEFAAQNFGFPHIVSQDQKFTDSNGGEWVWDGKHWDLRAYGRIRGDNTEGLKFKGDGVTISGGVDVSKLRVRGHSAVGKLVVKEPTSLDELLAKGFGLLEEIRDAVAKPKPDWEHWHDVPDLTPYRGQSMPVNGPYFVNVHTERVLYDHRTGKRTEVDDDFDAGPLIKAHIGEVWWDSAKVPDAVPYWEQHGAREVFFVNRGGARYIQNTREGKQSQRRSNADRASMIRRAPFVRATVTVSY